MRVLLYRRLLLNWGGAERYFVESASALNRLNNKVTVASSGFSSDVVIPSNIRQHHVPQRMTPIGGVALGLPRLLIRSRPHVVHVMGSNTATVPLQMTGPWVRILTPFFHDDPHSADVDVLRRKRLARLLRWATGLVFMTNAEADAFRQYCGTTRLPPYAVIPPAVSLPVPTEQRPRTGFLAIARLEPTKRLEYVVEAAAQIGKLSELKIVGQGTGEHDIAEHIRRLGEDPHRIMMGRVSDERLADLLRSARVVVSMSESESFGITVVEGIASGAAVIASAIPAHRAALAGVPHHCYQLIMPGDVGALGHALLDPPILPVMGSYTRTWSDAGSEMNDFYQQLRER